MNSDSVNIPILMSWIMINSQLFLGVHIYQSKAK